MNQMVLHYVYDPLCGWCYGAAPLLQAAAHVADLHITLHAGGLWIGERRQPMGVALRDYVRPHDERIAALTGQRFGERYFGELLLDSRRMLDSEPPIRAILAVEACGGNVLEMLHRVQQTHYQDGLWIGDLDRLSTLAQHCGVDDVDFRAAYAAAPLTAHLRDSQQWLRRIGSHGYPTLALEHDGRLILLAAADYLGKPAEFVRHLAQCIAA